MDSKSHHKKIIERYVNRNKHHLIETWYGGGSYVNIHNIDASYTKKIVIVDVKIILGDVINEEVMDRGLVEYLLENVLSVLYPDFFYKLIVSWDC